MTLIHRYVTRETLKFIAVVLTTVVSIYLCVDFFEKIDNFMDAGLPMGRALVFFLYNIPFITAQVLPVALLLAVLIVLGLMSRNNEILALKSSGVSIYSLLRPVFTLGVLFSIALFFFTEGVVPATSEKANRIWLQEVKKKAAVISREKNIWIKDNQAILYIAYYNQAHRAIYGLTLYQFDDAFRLARRVDAKMGLPEKDRWLLYRVSEQVRDPKTGEYDVTFLDARFEPLNLVPEDLETAVKTSEEMNFKELLAYIGRVEAEGYDATPYRVDLHAKVAFPVICIILSMVGTGIALRERTKEGMPVSIAYGLGVAFLYWILYSFCVSMGYGGILPPVAAAWTANVIFFCLGALLLLNAE